jgi:hypothetical protein
MKAQTDEKTNKIDYKRYYESNKYRDKVDPYRNQDTVETLLTRLYVSEDNHATMSKGALLGAEVTFLFL